MRATFITLLAAAAAVTAHWSGYSDDDDFSLSARDYEESTLYTREVEESYNDDFNLQIRDKLDELVDLYALKCRGNVLSKEKKPPKYRDVSPPPPPYNGPPERASSPDNRMCPDGHGFCHGAWCPQCHKSCT